MYKENIQIQKNVIFIWNQGMVLCKEDKNMIFFGILTNIMRKSTIKSAIIVA